MKTRLGHLSDDAVLKRLSSLVHDERGKTVEIIEGLVECHRRGIILKRGHGSMLQYCLQVLHLSEHEAYHRIYAMHCALKYPIILEMLRDGSVHLTTIRLLGPHLRRDNHVELLHEARHKSKFEIMKLVARINPQPALPCKARKLPVRREETASLPQESAPLLSLGSANTPNGNGGEPRPEDVAGQLGLSPDSKLSSNSTVTSSPAGDTSGIPPKRSVHRDPVTPLAPELYKFEFAAGAGTLQKLQQVKELLRHQVPDGDTGVVFDMALSLLLEKLLDQKLGRVAGPRKKKPEIDSVRTESKSESESESESPARPSLSSSPKRNTRHISGNVRREVWTRDGGQCAFKAEQGQRCPERGGLEFHHVTPFAWGGKATLQNIELRCRAHNAFEGEQIFGHRRREVLRE